MSNIAAQRAKPVQRYDIVQALAANGKAVVAGTQSGVMLVSQDQGKTWNRRTLGPSSVIGLATCPDGSFVGIDFHSQVWSAAADGQDWKSVKLDKPRTPLAVTCDASNGWWVAGSNATIASSRDHGATWTVTDLKQDAQLTTLQFVDASFAIATGEFGLVLASEDGGATWTKRPKLANEFYPYATLFTNRSDGWISGLAGQVLQTHDGGKTWASQDNTTGAPLYQLFLHRGQPYGVGAAGVVARLEGGAWRAVPYPDAAPVFLGAAVSLNDQNAIVIGGPGALLRAIGVAVN